MGLSFSGLRWLAAAGLVACGTSDPTNGFAGRSPATDGSGGSAGGSGGASGDGAGGASGIEIITVPPDGGFAGASAGGPADAASVIGALPSDFTRTEAGGYKLGQPIMGGGVADTGIDAGACNEIVGVVRDFKGFDAGGHPDYEHFAGTGTKGLVADRLGIDLKPVYTGICETPGMNRAPPCPDGQVTTGQAKFDQWYRFTDGVNKPYLLYLHFQATPGRSIITFNSQHFFPLDGVGWQSPGVAGADAPRGGDDGNLHNFSFTTEVHTKFIYRGGETFTFEGDDDLWVFMNGELAIDLGGLHGALRATVNLDASAPMLGLTRGMTYPLDLFHAERHTTASHFRIDSTLSLVDCGTIPPDAPIR